MADQSDTPLVLANMSPAVLRQRMEDLGKTNPVGDKSRLSECGYCPAYRNAFEC